MYACLYRPPVIDHDDRIETSQRGLDPKTSAVSALNVVNVLVAVAREFSPRFERHGDDLVSVDVSGLDRLIGPPRTIGEELRREFPSGDANQVVVVLHDAQGRMRSPESVGRAFDFARWLASVPGVSRVEGPVSLHPDITRAQYQQIFGQLDSTWYCARSH